MKLLKVRMSLLLVMMMMMMMMMTMIIPVTSRLTSAKVISYRGLRKTKNGEMMCALDTATETISSSSQQQCAFRWELVN